LDVDHRRAARKDDAERGRGYSKSSARKPLGVTSKAKQFGPNRCMFESNFPVDKVSFSHHVLFNAFKLFSKSYSNPERAALFHDTAARAYRISGPG
jgi:predicted TIM-barrel fold metal-dependent hydrolase